MVELLTTRTKAGDQMSTDGTHDQAPNGEQRGGLRVKRGLAEMLKGGVIMDVVTPEQAKVAEEAGAVAVMALERVPADIRREGGVARMSDVSLIRGSWPRSPSR
jgi:pyridoxal 5'-phosphate synthase pdxS subunit